MADSKLDIIFTAPHPDDLEIGSGGTIAKLVKQGYRVGMVHMTNGEPTPRGTPEGRMKEMRGFLTLKDDYGLDFTTYRMRLVEIDKTIDLPIDGLIGMDYEQSVSFSLIADNPKLSGKDKLTVEIEVADDRGQRSTLTRVISIK